MAKKKAAIQKRKTAARADSTGKQLVIVESPAKARTINKYLGTDYLVMASVGHVRDLPDKNPKGIKDPVPGVDLEHNFKPTYQVIRNKGKTIKSLKEAAVKASGLWLATDLDREGEAIAWHLIEALGDSHSGVRKAAAVALGELGEPEAEEPLRGLLGSESESLRAAAGEAIRKIKLGLLPPGSRESKQ